MKKFIAPLAAGLFLVSSAQATVYTFQYTATISSLAQGEYGNMVPVTASTVPGAEFVFNDTVVGTFTYDTANTRQASQFVSPSYNKATYSDDAIVFSMSNARTNQTHVSTQTTIDVLDSRNAAKFTDAVTLAGGGYNSSDSYYMGLNFGGTSIDVLKRARLPGEELRGFETATFAFEYTYWYPDSTYQVVLAQGNITSINLIDTRALVSAVPEPGTYAMLLAGLGLLAWQRRRLG